MKLIFPNETPFRSHADHNYSRIQKIAPPYKKRCSRTTCKKINFHIRVSHHPTKSSSPLNYQVTSFSSSSSSPLSTSPSPLPLHLLSPPTLLSISNGQAWVAGAGTGSGREHDRWAGAANDHFFRWRRRPQGMGAARVLDFFSEFFSFAYFLFAVWSLKRPQQKYNFVKQLLEPHAEILIFADR